MGYEFDSAKSVKNKDDRGFGFELMEEFEWDSAITIPDDRWDYGEKRSASFGIIHGRLYVAIWTPRPPNKRIINLRKANNDERKFYEKERTEGH